MSITFDNEFEAKEYKRNQLLQHKKVSIQKVGSKYKANIIGETNSSEELFYHSTFNKNLSKSGFDPNEENNIFLFPEKEMADSWVPGQDVIKVKVTGKIKTVNLPEYISKLIKKDFEKAYESTEEWGTKEIEIAKNEGYSAIKINGLGGRPGEHELLGGDQIVVFNPSNANVIKE
jgi:hypothetical protein